MQGPRSKIPCVDCVRPLGFQMVQHTLLEFALAEENPLGVELKRSFVRLFVFLENRPCSFETSGGNLGGDSRSQIPIELVFAGQVFSSPGGVGGIAEDRQTPRRG